MITQSLLHLPYGLFMIIVWFLLPSFAYTQNLSLTVSDGGNQGYLFISNNSGDVERVVQLRACIKTNGQVISCSPPTSLSLPLGGSVFDSNQLPRLAGWLDQQLLELQRLQISNASLCADIQGQNGIRSNEACLPIRTGFGLASQLQLVFPFDEDTIYTPYPSLSWIPWVGRDVGASTYEIRVAEKRQGQSPEAAIRNNWPHYLERGLLNTVLGYPLTALTLEPGKTYAWQVRVNLKGRALSQSEVWTFVLADPNEDQPEPPKNYVRLHRNQPVGLHVIHHPELSFFFEDLYGAHPPRIQVRDSGGNRIRNLELHQDKENYFSISFSGIKPQARYQLEVFDHKQRRSLIEFTYQPAKR